jgi:ABC-type antimicrobial peptide transport system permease subunit
MDGWIDETLAPRRFGLIVLGLFTAVALALALVGVYGVIAYSVAQRTRELGIRMALGARPRAVLALVVRQSLRPVAIGLAGGTLAALAATRLLGGMLYGVAATDVVTFGLGALALAATATLAGLAAARRATRIDPLDALRSE